MAITIGDTNITQEIIDKYTSQGYWTGETLADYLDRAVKYYPDKTAVVDKKERVTYRELDVIATRVALGFLEYGIKKGDVVSVQLPNWNEFVYTHLALSKIGAVTNPIIPYYRQKELRYILGLAESVALVIPSEFRRFDYTSMIPDISPEVPSLKHVFVVGDSVPQGAISFKELTEKRWEEKYTDDYIKKLRPEGTDVDLILFSSGTEAEPKGVLHTHNSQIYVNKTVTRILGLSSVDVVLVPSPVSHGTGLQWGVRQAIMLGAKFVLQETWNAKEACRLIEEEKCSYVFAATPFVDDLIKFEEVSEYDLGSLRIFACAGAPIPRELGRQAETKLGCKLVPSYGATEHFVSTCCYPSDPPEKIYGSDGCAIPGVEVAIFDDNGRQLPVGETGELAVRGPSVAGGYYKRPELTKKTFTEEGWQFTGDLAVMDEDGYIRIVGRKKDVIIRGGFNISPTEIEDLLYTHPKIRSVAIVGMPDDRLGERSCAYIIPEDGETVTLEEVVSFLREKKIATQKLPERVEIVKELPMTASGKVQKYILRKDIARKVREEKEEKA
ncbi:MAG: AMP-binding protein [Deltaproteobacteria bacterium]|nr:AMP-binding protein [Deltaproteobacteria bacterium]MBW2025345.1 AMP-binding protein [Deltaproteobacteria bacterium]MBW2125212.1 AMP-binding protein [Deltaproteobacteria bacterium]